MLIFIPTTETDYIEATSYLSVTDADELIGLQRDSSDWDSLQNKNKEFMLNISSLTVDGVYSYQGLPTDENQLLKFPRDGSKSIPINLKYAVSLLALQQAKEETLKNIKSEKIGKMSWTFDTSKNENGITADVLSFLKPLRATSVRITYL